ncbi:MAG: sigma-70 family RNA polymerase sigma factor [Polyangiaceae bacterium]|nr:sigma-70 family RNA polymerase sigma factor [Polyangiaceae bacterium]
MKPFASIYQQYFDFVWASVRRLGVESAAVDDVVHDVFIVIHGRLHTLRRPEALRSWIYGIVRRTVSDHRRSQRVRMASGRRLACEADAPCAATPLDIAAQNEKVRLLFNLLKELDVPKREIFMMVELDELTVPEVAEILQIPVNTAYTRLRAARQAFEQALTRHEGQQERQAAPCRT